MAGAPARVAAVKIKHQTPAAVSPPPRYAVVPCDVTDLEAALNRMAALGYRHKQTVTVPGPSFVVVFERAESWR
jgi:hypothetical protein